MEQTIMALTMGDYNGVGPEVILKTLSRLDRSESLPLLIGRKKVFDYYRSLLGLKMRFREFTAERIRTALREGTDGLNLKNSEVALVEVGEDARYDIEPGRPTPDTGKGAMLAVALATEFCLEGTADAIVTAPISKEAISMAGYTYPGHTEFLAELTGTDHVQMILTSERLRVALVTIHIPLSKVPDSISSALVLRQLEELDRTLKRNFGVASPRLAVLGLNPHAGDGGVLGKEEQTIIEPGLEQARNRGIHADGPFAGDGYFGSGRWKDYDATLAMYHDQGLIPFKLLSFGRGVNVTAGLPVIRTSPDHGTGFDIAGTGNASPDSFKAACELAISMIKRRADR